METIIQLGLGEYGIGGGYHEGAACLLIERLKRQSTVGVVRDYDPDNLTGEGVIIRLGTREAAKVLMGRLRLAMKLLPEVAG